MNLHIVGNGVCNDSRVLREAEALYGSGLFAEVEIAGFEQTGLPETDWVGERRIWRVPLRSRGLPRDLVSQSFKYLEWRYRVIHAYRGSPLKMIHCHDLEPLPIGIRLKRLTGARLVYDAHELETERAQLGKLRRPIARLTEHWCMDHVDALITVSPSIRDWYQHRYPRVPASLVRNIPKRAIHGLEAANLRMKLDVPRESLLFIYQGGHARGRGIEITLEAFSDPAVKHHVVFMGEGELVENVRAAAARRANIHWLPPVPPDDVLPMTAGADIGLSLIEDIALSYRYCLPNKLFEYLLAGLPVMVSSTPDQAALITQYEVGWVVPMVQSEIVSTLISLDAAELQAKRDGVEGLSSELSWEIEAEQLLIVYRRVLSE